MSPVKSAMTPPSAGSPTAAVVLSSKLCVPEAEVHALLAHVTGTHAKLLSEKSDCGTSLLVLFKVMATELIVVISAMDSLALPTLQVDAATSPNGVPTLIVYDVPSGVV